MSALATRSSSSWAEPPVSGRGAAGPSASSCSWPPCSRSASCRPTGRRAPSALSVVGTVLGIAGDGRVWAARRWAVADAVPEAGPAGLVTSGPFASSATPSTPAASSSSSATRSSRASRRSSRRALARLGREEPRRGAAPRGSTRLRRLCEPSAGASSRSVLTAPGLSYNRSMPWPEPVERVAAFLRAAGAESRLEEFATPARDGAGGCGGDRVRPRPDREVPRLHGRRTAGAGARPGKPPGRPGEGRRRPSAPQRRASRARRRSSSRDGIRRPAGSRRSRLPPARRCSSSGRSSRTPSSGSAPGPRSTWRWSRRSSSCG